MSKTSGQKGSTFHHRKLNRRKFLKWSAACAALGANQILGSLSPVPASTPEKKKHSASEKWIVTSCLNCPGRCGIRVRVVNGKAVRISGNPHSRVSEGKVCPRAQIGLQVLYDPGRLLSPLRRTNQEKGRDIDPKWVSISWNQALDDITQRLKSLRETGQSHQLLVLGGLNTRSCEDMIVRFAEGFGTPNLVFGHGLETETEKSGNWMADGHYTETAYDLDHTNYILAFGADLLESSKPLSYFLRKWGKLRRENPNRTKVVVIHPRYSVTAAKSDEWIPIHPGTEGALALGLANVIIRENLYHRDFVHRWTSGFDVYKKWVVDQFSPETVSKITGMSQGAIQRIAREFAQTRPAVAVRGKAAIAWPQGSYTSYAIFCLNALVGSIDIRGGILYQENPKYKEMPPPMKDELARKGNASPSLDLRKTERFPAAEVVTNQIPESVLEGLPYPVQMAIGLNSNFNVIAPGTERWDRALKKLPFYIHFSPFISEMALYADLLLPSTTFLEEWGYDHSPPGPGFAETRIKQPVVQPLAGARSITDSLIEISKRLGGGLAQAVADINDSREFVRSRTETLVAWEKFTETGVWVGGDYQYEKYGHIFKTPSKRFEFYSGNLQSLFSEKSRGKRTLDGLPHFQEAHFLGEKEKFPLILIPYEPLLVFGNGSQNYPWAQEIFLPMHGVGWETLVEMNSETAAQFRLKSGQLVWVESPFHKTKARLKCSEGIHPGVVAISSGQGHYAYGRWQKGIGVNPNDLIGVDYDHISGQAAFFNTRVKVYKA